VVVGERAELFQVFLWIMNLPYALNTALLGEFISLFYSFGISVALLFVNTAVFGLFAATT